MNKDFKVKNGLQVADSATFGGTITAADPTSDSHVVTRGFLNQNLGKVNVSDSAPSSPVEGMMYFDSISQHIYIYFNSSWIAIATVDDTQNIPDHIHDTSIDGNGLIVSTFIEGGTPTSAMTSGTDAGTASTTDWSDTWSGGLAVDNFN